MLTNEQIAKVAPSVFATEAHHSRSDRYAYVSTAAVLAGLQAEGFTVAKAMQSRTRTEDKREFTKHMLRLRHSSAVGAKVGDVFPEIVLVNSHDGASAFHLMSGMFRLVCLNGMVSGQNHMDVKVRHSGNIRDQVIEGAFRVLDSTKALTGSVETMKALTLSRDEEVAFGRAAIHLKYDDGKAPIDGERLMAARRREDRAPDLWTGFNRAQENLIRGGQRYIGTHSRGTTRAVEGIDRSVAINRALWTLAEEMAKLKAAA